MAYPDPNFLPGRRYILSGLSVALALPAFPGAVSRALAMDRYEKAKEPKPLPDLAFTDAEDKAVNFADLKGKVLLINFWATWCAPCVKEMPSLDRLQAKIGKDKLVVIPLSLDGPTRPKVAPFYADKKLTSLGIWFDRSRKVMQALDVTILPTTILVDAKGRELGRLEGEADWDKPEAAALVSGALAG